MFETFLMLSTMITRIIRRIIFTALAELAVLVQMERRSPSSLLIVSHAVPIWLLVLTPRQIRSRLETLSPYLPKPSSRLTPVWQRWRGMAEAAVEVAATEADSAVVVVEDVVS